MKNKGIILTIVIAIIAVIIGIGIGTMLSDRNNDNSNIDVDYNNNESNSNNAGENSSGENSDNNDDNDDNSNNNVPDVIDESVETLGNGNKKVTKTHNNNKVIYEYAQGDYDFELISFSINNNSVFNELSNYFNTIEVETFKEFVIVKNSFGGNCGFENYNIVIYDYDGKQILKNDSIANDIDKLVFNGDYSYNENTKTLELNYHLSCDLDCNLCKELTNQEVGYVTCSSIEKYKNSISDGKYNLKYLGNGEFTELNLVNKSTLYEDEYYNHIFTNCR